MAEEVENRLAGDRRQFGKKRIPIADAAAIFQVIGHVFRVPLQHS